MKKRIILCLTFIVCLLVGCGSTNTDTDTPRKSVPVEKVYLEADEIEKAYSSADDYVGKYMVIGGQIFGEPELYDGEMYFQMYGEPENIGKNTVVHYIGNKTFKSGDYVMIDGVIAGTYTYTNRLGAEMSALTIETNDISESNYIECCSPTIREVVLDQTIDQHGYTITVEKIEFAEAETRVYLTITNGGSDDLSIFTYSAKMVQNQKQYEYQYNYSAGYEEIQTDLIPETSTSGVLTFPAMDAETGGKIYVEAYCSDWYTDLDDYVFEF